MTVKTPTRDEIILVATNMFKKYGYDKSSIYCIAKNVGLTKATIYHHFKSKEELLNACAEKYLKDFKELLSKNSLKKSIKLFYGNSDEGCLIFNLLATEHYTLIQDYVDDFIHTLESYIGDSIIDLIGSLLVKKVQLYDIDPLDSFLKSI